MKRKPFVWMVVAAWLDVFGAAARANDSSITWQGPPRLMDSHRSVSMRSEVVRLSVGKTTMTADCRFVFVNNGPACTVRMGFPDSNIEENEGSTGPPYAHFLSFTSWVDGARVATRRVRGSTTDDESAYWRVKTVKFGGRGTKTSVRRVRDLYTVAINGETMFLSPSHEVGYTLHTGSSLHGAIGRSEIIVTFARWNKTLRAVPLSTFQGRNKDGSTFMEAADSARVTQLLGQAGAVVYAGPGWATVRGNTLRWVRTRWRPTESDDISIHCTMP